MQAASSLKKTIIKIFKIKINSKNNTDAMAMAANKIKLIYYYKKAMVLSNKTKAAKKIQKMFKRWKKAQEIKED